MILRFPRQLGFLLIISIVGITSAWSQDPKIRVSLAAPDEIWTGQRIILRAELAVPGYFASAPAFDLPDPPGLLLVPPGGSPVINSEDIDGTNYTVQRHEISIFTNRGGRQTVPPFKVRFSYKRNPLDHDPVAMTLESPPLDFSTKVPPGAENLGTVISARDLKAVESWKPEPGKAKAGDAFTRTIIFTAPDVPAMAFPPFPSPPLDGLGIYPKPPVVADHSERGDLHGERRDSISYVCKRSGTFIIPASRLTWFDLDSKQLRTIDFPARTIEVAPNPALASSTAAATKSTLHWKSLLIAFFSIALGAAAIRIVTLPQVRGYFAACLRPLLPVHLEPLNPTCGGSDDAGSRHHRNRRRVSGAPP